MSNMALNRLIELAKEARDKASQLLASEHSTSQQITEQVRMLETYRREYGEQLEGMASKGINLASLQDYQHFLASLDRAIDLARRGRDEQHRKVTRCQQHWQREQKRLSSFDLLMGRRKTQEALCAQRRELRHNDEISAGVSRNRQTSADNDI